MTPMKELARSIRSRWREGQPPDALDALQAHPDLGQDNSAVIELAYEEYCLRREAGEVIDHRAFCERFPGCRSALRQMLSFDLVIGANPDLFADVSSAADWLQAGEMAGDCRVIRELGQGAFSRVYLAHEASLDRFVALKVSRLATSEAQALAKMGHEHIVTVHWERHDELGRSLVCMPWVGGATLTHVLDRLYPRQGTVAPRLADDVLKAIASTVQPGDPEPVRPVAGPSLRGLSFARGVGRLGQSLAATLAYLHKMGRAHCDLKPANVLLTAEGQPLLLDFNLSRGPADGGGRLGGTFPYMAPEQLSAFLSGKAMSETEAASADVFALGVLLCELLTGEHPFGVPLGASPRACAESMQELHLRRALPVRQLNPQVPRKLAALVERCMELEPAVRPTAGQVADLLCERPVRWPRIAAAACVVVVGIGLTAWAVRSATVRAAAPLVIPQPDSKALRKQGLAEVKEARRLLAPNEAKEAEAHLRAADEAFGTAIEAQIQHGTEPVAWTDYFERGRVRLLLGDRAGAQDYFQQADKAHLDTAPAKRDGRTLAYMAYTHALTARHEEAVAISKEALKVGFRTAALWNNLGYSHMKRTGEFKVARSCFTNAIDRDRSLAAPYHNRAVLAFRSCPKSPPPQAAKDIDEAISLAGKSGLVEPAALYREGVLIHLNVYQQAKAKNNPDHESHLRKAAGYLERACFLGLDPGPFLRLDPNLKAFCKQSILDEGRLAALRNQKQVPAVWTYLVEPVGD